MSEQQGLGVGQTVIHVLVSLVVAVFVAERFAGGEDIVINAEAAGALGMTAVGIVSVVFLKWRQRRSAAGLTTGQMVAARLAEVERREAEVDAVHTRLAELEERLDFSERLLARAESRDLVDRHGA